MGEGGGIMLMGSQFHISYLLKDVLAELEITENNEVTWRINGEVQVLQHALPAVLRGHCCPGPSLVENVDYFVNVQRVFWG